MTTYSSYRLIMVKVEINNFAVSLEIFDFLPYHVCLLSIPPRFI